ncbi:hypothetical protein L0Z72_11080 [candidate division KSB1 bacterium]|nr:hypothetical protein [candidate division KSB1 bacterium]
MQLTKPPCLNCSLTGILNVFQKIKSDDGSYGCDTQAKPRGGSLAFKINYALIKDNMEVHDDKRRKTEFSKT